MSIISGISAKQPLIGKELNDQCFGLSLGAQITVNLVGDNNDGLLFPAFTAPSANVYCADGQWRSQPAIIPGFGKKHISVKSITQELNSSGNVFFGGTAPIDINANSREYTYMGVVLVPAAGLTYTLSVIKPAEFSTAMIGKIVSFKTTGSWTGSIVIKQDVGNIEGGDYPNFTFNRTVNNKPYSFNVVWSGTSWYGYRSFIFN